MYDKTKCKDKKQFCMNCLKNFSCEEIFINHKNSYLEIIRKESISKHKEGSNVQFINYHKQLKDSFVIYTEFESNLKFKSPIKIMPMHPTLTYIKKILLAVMFTKLYVLLIDLVSQFKNIDVNMQFTGLLKKCLKRLNIANISRKKIQKGLIITKENKITFQIADNCQISDKLYDNKDGKVRSHCHVRNKYIGSAH